jgi:hypothetical protein
VPLANIEEPKIEEEQINACKPIGKNEEEKED